MTTVADDAVIHKRGQHLIAHVLSEFSLSPIDCENIVDFEGIEILQAALAGQKIPNGFVAALLCLLIGSKTILNFLRAFKVIRNWFCITDYFWILQQELLRQATLGYLRLLLDAEGYKLEDLENCIKTLMPSLKKQLPLFPVELQHRIGHLTEEIDNLTAGILCADAIDRLCILDEYSEQYELNTFVNVAVTNLRSLLEKFRGTVQFNLYVERKRLANPIVFQPKRRKLQIIGDNNSISTDISDVVAVHSNGLEEHQSSDGIIVNAKSQDDVLNADMTNVSDASSFVIPDSKHNHSDNNDKDEVEGTGMQLITTNEVTSNVTMTLLTTTTTATNTTNTTSSIDLANDVNDDDTFLQYPQDDDGEDDGEAEERNNRHVSQDFHNIDTLLSDEDEREDDMLSDLSATSIEPEEEDKVDRRKRRSCGGDSLSSSKGSWEMLRHIFDNLLG